MRRRRTALAAVSVCACLLLTHGAAPKGHADGIADPVGAAGAQSGDASPTFAAIAAEPSANRYTGVANLSVSIVVPPGRRSMTPRVSLDYTSTGGPGPYGDGWRYAPGSIRRETRFGVPAYGPGDDFVLELAGGAQDLVFVPSSGRYRARIEGEYRLIAFDEAENTWTVMEKSGMRYRFGARAHSRTGPAADEADGTFAWHLTHAEDPAGNSIEYVYVPQAEGEATAPGLVESIRYGGAPGIDHFLEVQFDWEHPWEHQGPGWKHRVSYREGFARRVVPRRLRRIVTYAEDREVRRYGMSHSVDPASSRMQLDGVSLVATSALGEQTPVPSSVFLYADPLQTSFPVGEARDEDPEADFTFEGAQPFRATGSSTAFDVFDVDADSIPDWVSPAGVRLGTGTGFGQPVAWSWPDYAIAGNDNTLPLNAIRRVNGDAETVLDTFDIDGDALPDLVLAGHSYACGSPDVPFGTSAWCVYRNNGTGFELVPVPFVAPYPYIRDQLDDSGDVHQEVLDLNADGLVDIVSSVGWSESSPYWTAYLSRTDCDSTTGCGFDANEPTQWPAPGPLMSKIEKSVTQSAGWSRVRTALVDMNGDGLVDFLDTGWDGTGDARNRRSEWLVSLNTGRGFAAPVSWSVGTGEQAPAWLHGSINSSVSTPDGLVSVEHDLFDVTGDGLPDIVRPYLYGTPGVIDDDEAGIPQPACEPGLPVCPADFSEVPPDCCASGLLFVNTGAGFSEPVAFPLQDETFVVRRYSDQAQPSGGRETDFMDIDGDGLVDAVERIAADGEVRWRVHRHPAVGVTQEAELPAKPGLLTASLNGLGAATVIGYAPVSRLGDGPCVADPGAETGRSGRCLPHPHWVVSELMTADLFDRSPVMGWQYDYAHPYFDSEERSFRGFREVAVRDGAGLSKLSVYHQDTACAGRLRSAYEFGAGSIDPWTRLLGVEEREWDCGLTDPGPAAGRVSDAEPEPVKLRVLRKTPYVRSEGQAPSPAADLVVETAFEYDRHGNERYRIVHAAGLRPVVTETRYSTRYAAPTSGLPSLYQRSRPVQVATSYADAEGGLLTAKTFRYDAQLNVRETADCMSIAGSACTQWIKTKYTRYVAGLPGLEKGPGKQKTKITYDDRRMFAASRVFADRLTLSIGAYDYATGQAVEQTDEAGARTRTEYDGLGRLTARWDGRETFDGAPDETRTYLPPDIEAGGLSVTGIARLGAPFVAQYFDGRGRLVASKAESETYDSAGNDRLAVVVSGLKAYDAVGRVVAAAPPFEVTGTEPGFDTLEATVDSVATDALSVNLFDPATGELAEQIAPSPAGAGVAVRRFVRGVPGLSAVVDEVDGVSVSVFDPFGRALVEQRCAELPNVEAGQVCPAHDVLFEKRTVYDGLGRRLSVWQIPHENGAALAPVFLESKAYDGLGNELESFGAATGLWRYAYDRRSGLLSERTSADGSTVAYKRDRRDRIKRETRTDARGHRSTIRYEYHRHRRAPLNGNGRLSIVRADDLQGDGAFEKRFEYDARGNAVRIEESVSVGGAQARYTTQLTYDANGRLSTRTIPRVSGGGQLVDEAVSYGYSGRGRLETIDLVSESGTEPLLTRNMRDHLGRPAAIHYGNGASDRFDYADATAAGVLECALTTRSQLTWYEGDACSPAHPLVDLRGVAFDERDHAGRVLSIADILFGDTVDHAEFGEFAYDGSGRLSSWTRRESGATATDEFEYDPFGNLRSLGGFALAYESAANPFAVTGSAGAEAHSYDANGSRVASGARELHYDANQKLIRVEDGGTPVERNWYDELGRRIARETNGSLTFFLAGSLEISQARLVRFHRFDDRLIATDDGALPPGLLWTAGRADGSAAVRSARGLALVEHAQAASLVSAFGAMFVLAAFAAARRDSSQSRLPRWTAAVVAPAYAAAMVLLACPVPARAGAPGGFSERTFYHLDHAGSPVLATDENAAVAGYVRYSPFGEVRGEYAGEPWEVSAAGTGSFPNAGFTGAEQGAETGLMLIGARFYDSASASFLTADPIDQYASAYAYAGYEPMNGRDADGRFFLEAAGAVAAISALLSTTVTVWAGADLGDVLKAGVVEAARGSLIGTGLGVVESAIGALFGESAAHAFSLAYGAQGVVRGAVDGQAPVYTFLAAGELALGLGVESAASPTEAAVTRGEYLGPGSVIDSPGVSRFSSGNADSRSIASERTASDCSRALDAAQDPARNAGARAAAKARQYDAARRAQRSGGSPEPAIAAEARDADVDEWAARKRDISTGLATGATALSVAAIAIGAGAFGPLIGFVALAGEAAAVIVLISANDGHLTPETALAAGALAVGAGTASVPSAGLEPSARRALSGASAGRAAALAAVPAVGEFATGPPR